MLISSSIMRAHAQTLIQALQTCFSKNGNPKVMNSRHDTIARAMLPHFLKDGMLLLVSFPNHVPITGAQVNRPIQTPLNNLNATATPTSNGPNHDLTGNTGSNMASPLGNVVAHNNTNPPTPYSPPLPVATPPRSLYQTASVTPNSTSVTTTSNPPPGTGSGSGTGPASATAYKAPNTPSSSSSPRVVDQIYKLSRTISTVGELWQEWEKGLSPDKPSVIQLETMYGPKWRSSQAERKFYSRRKVIIEEVRKQMEQGRSEWEALSIVDEWREGKSLDALSKIIAERRKAAIGNYTGGRSEFDAGGGGGRGGGVGRNARGKLKDAHDGGMGHGGATNQTQSGQGPQNTGVGW
jgi:hypothetical protein